MENLIRVCEFEKLHLSGEIQPHGALLCIDALGIISHCSSNITNLIGMEPKALLGEHAQLLFGDAMSHVDGTLQRVLVERAWHFNGEQDFLFNSSDAGGFTVEIYPHVAPEYPVRHQYTAFETPRTDAEMALIRQELIEEIAELTGFQRIMFYQFVEDNDGEVIAEFCKPSVQGSYLGLRFPASDIPKIARDLYVKNPWRMIPDAAVDSIPIIGLEQGAPDLSCCDLRSVSLMHKIYLANMGVSASLSFPVVTNGVLVALVACHDEKANTLSQTVLEQCRNQVNRYGLTFSAYTAYQRMTLVDGLNGRFKDIQTVIQRTGSVVDSWNELAPWIMREFNVDGVVLTGENTVLKHGLALEDQTLAVVAKEFAQSSELVWSKDCLSRQLSSFVLSEVAGVFALKLGSDLNTAVRLYLCQAEQIQEIAWGGSPEKPVEYHDGKLGIAPRRSFAKWVEKRVGYSLPWDNKTRLLTLKLRELLTGASYA